MGGGWKVRKFAGLWGGQRLTARTDHVPRFWLCLALRYLVDGDLWGPTPGPVDKTEDPYQGPTVASLCHAT